MENVKVSELIPHPRNSEFFDDIKGDGWDDFLKSIRTSGVTNAITIDQRNIIISGHQRVRACELLGIEKIPANRITYTEEELNAEYPKDVKDLIESNLKQRVAGNANAVKLARCINFLEGYYGIKHGNNQHKEDTTNGRVQTQKTLAESIGIDERTLQRIKRINSLPSEVQKAVEEGRISASTAVRTIAKLPKEEQFRIVEELSGGEKRFTESEVRQLIKEHTSQENQRLESKIRELENREPEVREVVKIPQEVKDKMQKMESDLQGSLHENSFLAKERQQYLNERNEYARQLKELQGRSAEQELSDKAIKESEFFVSLAYDFIQRAGGYVWLKDHLSDIPQEKLNKYKKALFELDSMIKIMIDNAGGYEIT